MKAGVCLFQEGFMVGEVSGGQVARQYMGIEKLMRLFSYGIISQLLCGTLTKKLALPMSQPT